MKKLFIASLVILFTVNGFTQEASEEHKKMSEQAFELLVKSIDDGSINVVGDIKKDEKIKDVIGDILIPLMDALSFSDGDNDRELIEMDCKKTELAAVCTIAGALYVPEGGIDVNANYSLDSTPAIKTSVQFAVSLDVNQKPERILENRVSVIRVKLNGAK
ncbi:hypothetical protein K2P97_10440 [bacterium]|nr:hypothetical protein [bacterium]